MCTTKGDTGIVITFWLTFRLIQHSHFDLMEHCKLRDQDIIQCSSILEQCLDARWNGYYFLSLSNSFKFGKGLTKQAPCNVYLQISIFEYQIKDAYTLTDYVCCWFWMKILMPGKDQIINAKYTFKIICFCFVFLIIYQSNDMK